MCRSIKTLRAVLRGERLGIYRGPMPDRARGGAAPFLLRHFGHQQTLGPE